MACSLRRRARLSQFRSTGRCLSTTRWGTVACVVVVLFPVGVFAQSSDTETPRTPWGVPDLNGVWDYRNVTPLVRPALFGDQEVLTDEQVATLPQLRPQLASSSDGPFGGTVHPIWWLDYGSEVTTDRHTSLIVDPATGTIPLLTPAAQRVQETEFVERARPVRKRMVAGSPAHGLEDFGLSERCLAGFSTGPPFKPAAYNNNVQLFLTPSHAVIFTEMIHDARIVPLDGRAPLAPAIRQWSGDSRGSWEGDTLVVTTTNFTAKTASFDPNPAIGLGSAEHLTLVERFTRVDGEQLLYEFTVDDPITFSARFTAALPMRRTDAPVYEYACHEGNYAMGHMLRGARATEMADPDGR